MYGFAAGPSGEAWEALRKDQRGWWKERGKRMGVNMRCVDGVEWEKVEIVKVDNKG